VSLESLLVTLPILSFHQPPRSRYHIGCQFRQHNAENGFWNLTARRSKAVEAVCA
jgi:hypothetical protein